MASKVKPQPQAAAVSKKLIYFFSAERTEGDLSLKKELGGKGAGLAEMAKLGIRIPPGFTIVCDACAMYYANGKQIPAELQADVWRNLEALEKLTGKRLGDASDPLLLSVRSGAYVSMPGMMDTILNLGLNDETVKALGAKTNNVRFALDSYRRFIHMFGATVMGITAHAFSDHLEKTKKNKMVSSDTDLDAQDLSKLVADYKALYQAKVGKQFPQDVREQLILSVQAVFESWNSDRAVYYRKLNDIRGLSGTAVNVQTMVFGNMGNNSGTGVAFSRDPSSGEKRVVGEFLVNAQGEDVVAGIRTPQQIEEMDRVLPECYKQFLAISERLEHHFRDVQDMEFTIEGGTLYMLQTRSAKRTAPSALKTAIDFVTEGLITRQEAILRIDPTALNQLLHPYVPAKAIELAKKKGFFLGKGLNASPGAAEGHLVFSTTDARQMLERGKNVILVRHETSPEDIEGMVMAQGVLTARGGMTSHAAVVARGMGKCCICGWTDIVQVNEEKKYFRLANGKQYAEGELITLIGDTGEVFLGKLPMQTPDISSGYFKTLMDWSDEFAKTKVRANADVPKDAKTALDFGAQGIGLCRTEHMFFKRERISKMRQMILATDAEEQKKHLRDLEVFQRSDFQMLFTVMWGKPVTIRLLDPPLHEFLPHEDHELKEIAAEMKLSIDTVRQRVLELSETNPMLGHRGCRLGITFPEITAMQARAIFEAAAECAEGAAIPEIMVPLVGFDKELSNQREIIEHEHQRVEQRLQRKIPYLFGTMIEVPRGALKADEIARAGAHFFSFGTNDLTQMTCGFSRDDAGKFLSQYVKLGIIEKDPFQQLDHNGVGELMRIAVERGRSVMPNIKLGICGEHGGDPQSIAFCHSIGLDYVSCSPYRVPIARLAAAQAQIRNPRVQKQPKTDNNVASEHSAKL